MHFPHQLGKINGKINWIGSSGQFGAFRATLQQYLYGSLVPMERSVMDTMGVSVDLCVVFHTSIAYHFKKSNFIYFKTLLKAWYGWIERKSSKQNKGLLKFFNGISFKYPWNIKNVAIRRLLCCKYSLCCYFRWKGIEAHSSIPT